MARIGARAGAACGGMPELALVEGPSLGSTGGQMAHEAAGNWHRVVARLFDLGVQVVEVSPSQVKQYATGSGSTQGKTKVTKEMVISAVNLAYGDVGARIVSNDMADALILAALENGNVPVVVPWA